MLVGRWEANHNVWSVKMKFLCSIGLHGWIYLPQRNFRNQRVRMCKRCQKREVWFYWFNRADGYWEEDK